jgi:hypothetical protein
MDSLYSLLGSLAVLAVLAGLMLLARKFRIRELQKRVLDDEETQRLSEELLAYVKHNSLDRGQDVRLSPFWRTIQRDRKRNCESLITEGDRLQALVPLSQSNTLLIRIPENWAERLAQKAIDWVMLPLPETVFLRPSEYDAMGRGALVKTIVEGAYYDMRDMRNIDQSITAHNSAVTIGALQAGDNSKADVKNVRSNNTGLTPQHMEALADALRADATNLTQREAANTLEELANECDDAATEGSNNGKFEELVTKATSYATLISGGLEATDRLISSWTGTMGS